MFQTDADAIILNIDFHKQFPRFDADTDRTVPAYTLLHCLVC